MIKSLVTYKDKREKVYDIFPWNF